MTYFDTFPAARRTIRDAGVTDNALLRLSVTLALFTALSTALSFGGVPKVNPAPGNDWHGNVARSGGQ